MQPKTIVRKKEEPKPVIVEQPKAEIIKGIGGGCDEESWCFHHREGSIPGNQGCGRSGGNGKDSIWIIIFFIFMMTASFYDEFCERKND